MGDFSMLGPSFIILALGAVISTEASKATIDCSGMRGEKHTEESWECDGENEVDICRTEITDCSDGGNLGEAFGGRVNYFFNGQQEGVGQGWDCRDKCESCSYKCSGSQS